MTCVFLKFTKVTKELPHTNFHFIAPKIVISLLTIPTCFRAYRKFLWFRFVYFIPACLRYDWQMLGYVHLTNLWFGFYTRFVSVL